MTFWQVIQEAGTKLFFEQLLTSTMTLYGLLFVFDLLCLILILKKFFPLYNIQTGNNYVMSSSDMFSDDKGTLPMRVWLMLLIPFFYIYFILYYATKLKELYPKEKVRMPLLWTLTLVLTVVCLLLSASAGFVIQAYLDVLDKAVATKFLTLLPILLVAASNAWCFWYLLKTIRLNFYMPDEKDA